MLPDELRDETMSKTEREAGQGGGRREGFAPSDISEGLHPHAERPCTQPSLCASRFSWGSVQPPVTTACMVVVRSEPKEGLPFHCPR